VSLGVLGYGVEICLDDDVGLANPALNIFGGEVPKAGLHLEKLSGILQLDYGYRIENSFR
jgi:hypothetical protein